MAELQTVLLIDNLRAQAIWTPDAKLEGFDLQGITEATHQAVERALQLQAESRLAGAMIILDHHYGGPDPTQRIHRKDLMSPALSSNQKDVRGACPNIEDLHPSLTRQIEELLNLHDFNPSELGILITETALADAKRRFGQERAHCVWVTASAFLLMAENDFDPTSRRRKKREEPVSLEIHASNHGGLPLEYAVEAKEIWCPSQALPAGRIDLRYTTYTDLEKQETGADCPISISSKEV